MQKFSQINATPFNSNDDANVSPEAAQLFNQHCLLLSGEIQQYHQDVCQFDVYNRPLTLLQPPKRRAKQTKKGAQIRLCSISIPGVSEHAPHVIVGDQLLIRFVIGLSLNNRMVCFDFFYRDLFLLQKFLY